jgi:hypothetical protein
MDGPPDQVLGRSVTPNVFDVLSVRPILERSFTALEDRPGMNVVIIEIAGGKPAARAVTVTRSM